MTAPTLPDDLHDDPAADSNWVKARSSFVWLAALGTAFGLVWWIEAASVQPPASAPSPAQATMAVPASADLPASLPGPRPLDAREQAWARAAWAWFERNTDAATGLAGSVEGFPSASAWDTGSQLLALLSARDLGLVEPPAFDRAMARLLDALARLPLHAGRLPNKTYDIHTLAPTDYANRPAPEGTGWSAIDLGRLVVPLQAIAWKHPQHTAAARRVLARWQLEPLVRDGQLWGWQPATGGGAGQAVQEGRLGYEQYAARAMALLGLETPAAADPTRHLRWVEVEGIAVPVDARAAAPGGPHAPTVSEPWILMGLELGWGTATRELAWRVYRAQEQRAARSGVLTAATEDHLDRAPHFAWYAVHDGGRQWIPVDEQGREVPGGRTLSTKAAFGWHALLRTPYTARLVEALAPHADPVRGWPAGLREEDGRPNAAYALNTNAVVLESLAYIARGPLLPPR